MSRRRLTKGNRENGSERGKVPAGTREEVDLGHGQEHLREDGSRSPEHLRHERLGALLRDVAERMGKVNAAQALGVSYRTLARAVESGRLTGRMADALERHLSEVKASAPAPVRQEQADGLEERAAQLEADVETLRARVDTMQAVVGALQEDQARTLRQWERRLARLEARRVPAKGSGAGSPPRVKGAPEQAPVRPEVKSPKRAYPRLITIEPEAGEELLYGEAMLAITEWRAARKTLQEARRRLDKLDARMRMVDVAISLIGDHELTLPPAVSLQQRFLLCRGREGHVPTGRGLVYLAQRDRAADDPLRIVLLRDTWLTGLTRQACTRPTSTSRWAPTARSRPSPEC